VKTEVEDTIFAMLDVLRPLQVVTQ